MAESSSEPSSMGAVCGCIWATAISSGPERVKSELREPESAETKNGGSKGEIDETRALTVQMVNNKRVEEARRARVEWLERLRRKCGSEEEFQTARSQPLLTQLTSTSCSSSSCTPNCLSPADLERIHQENCLHFQHLMDTEDHEYRAYFSPGLSKGGFFTGFYVDFGDRLEVGKKIGGGGQADIHEAVHDGEVLNWCVLRVFRSDYLLVDLQCVWTKGIASLGTGFQRLMKMTCCFIKHGTLLQDGRFAFVLQRCWGDLRRLNDLEIVKDKTHQSPPFPNSSSVRLMMHIAYGMVMLHRKGILHKDLKAANCLLPYNHEDRRLPNLDACLIGDYESCEGVGGTGFWRAPEILLALKNKEGDINSFKKLWTMKADVYGYAMTCYEILTGCIPFEDCARNDYDSIIHGERPPLPNYVDPKLEELVRRCWHNVPYMRPTFEEIVAYIAKTYPNYVDTLFDF